MVRATKKMNKKLLTMFIIANLYNFLFILHIAGVV